MNGKVKKVEFLYQNHPSRRKIKVTMTSGNTIYIEPCHESWEQYGGTNEELWQTVPIANRFNKMAARRRTLITDLPRGESLDGCYKPKTHESWHK